MLLPLANLFGLDPGNWLVLALIALLLFGKKLPEVGKSLGKGIIEFKKGLQGVEDDIDQAGRTPASSSQNPDQPVLPTSYKFDPYTGKPLVEPPTTAPAQMRFDPYTGKPLESAASPSSSNP
jgi:sec-independent protein translocase protein TatA